VSDFISSYYKAFVVSRMEKMKKYYLGGQISEGGYGKVYHGYYPKYCLQVCIKELGLSLAGGEQWNAKNEIKILKMVNHPSIVKYLDDYRLNEKQYIVMELI
jgi:serine/threonine protein kinase